jgi:hypothetical protein
MADEPRTCPRCGVRSDALHLVQCAAINLENLARLAPGLDLAPMWGVVRLQLGWAMEALGGEAELPAALRAGAGEEARRMNRRAWGPPKP